jgi:dedicator of cytokinesis protein 3
MCHAGLVVSVRVLCGELDLVLKEHPLLLKNVRVTNKMGFSDVIMPGDVRNDLYLTLSHGEFERAGKSVGKNIEVTVVALDSTGTPINVSFGLIIEKFFYVHDLEDSNVVFT